MINSSTNLAQPVKLPVETELKEETTILGRYENKILELERKVEEQENIINKLKQLLYNHGYLTENIFNYS
jgi:predicted RNase H-like nuclease (RuvC/YqgF family)